MCADTLEVCKSSMHTWEELLVLGLFELKKLTLRN